MTVPRAIGSSRLPEVFLARKKTADGLAHHVPVLGMIEIAQDLGDAEDAHGQHREVDAVGQERQAEGHALLAGLKIGADRREQNAEKDHRHGFQDRAVGEHDREDQAHDHQGEILRWAEQQRKAGEWLAKRRDDEGRHGAGE